MPVERRRQPFRALLVGSFTLVLALGSLVASTTPTQADGLTSQTVQRFLDDYRSRHGLPGIQVAVVKDGAIVAEAGSGHEVTPRTPWGIGSTTKPITAFAVLQLVDSGAVGLDDLVVDRLPAFQPDDPRARAITIRQLLSHTSGLPNPTLVAPATSPAERVAQLREVRLIADPGTAYAYSNLNYHLAARLIEVVSGQSYQDYLERHVFAPLGMSDTRATVTKDEGPGYRDGHVTAYGAALPLPELVGMNAGSGDIVSTAHDLALWLAMYQRGGTTTDGTPLLSPELVEQSTTDQPHAGPNTLGWQHTQTSVPQRVGKDGSLTRFSSRIELVESSGYGVAVLLNSYTPTMKHPFEIGAGIIALTEGRAPDVGFPLATTVDLVLAVITIMVAALMVRGVVRANRWAARRQTRPAWRYGLRLLPHLVLPLAAVVVFGILPVINANTGTPVDAFGLWPAAMVLLLVGALGGLALVVARSIHRVRSLRATSDRD